MRSQLQTTAIRPLDLSLSACLLLLLQWSCGKGPTQADVKKANEPPETFISATKLSKVPLATDSTGAVTNFDEFAYIVEYTARDVDGKVDSFSVRIDGGPWSAWTEKTKSSGSLDFVSTAASHMVEVKSKDNEGAEDPSPAQATLTLALASANKAPTTTFISGPVNGGKTGPGVMFQVSGDDDDGKIASFVYSVDGGSEQSLTADANGRATIDFTSSKGNLFASGNHSVSVFSVDNLGAKDPTPESRSFFVAPGFAPILSQSGGPLPGGGWFTGAGIPFAWSVSTVHYFGVVDHYEYSLNDPVNFISISSQQISLDPQPAGQHIFRVRAVDTGGGVSNQLEIDFEVALFAPTEGILFIDNVNFNPSTGVYADEPDADQKILQGFFKNFGRVSVWDVDYLSGASRFPSAVNTKNLPGPSDLAKYSSVVIMTDGGYTVDDISPLLAAYFQAGGNLMITGYQTLDFGQVLKDAMGTPTITNGSGRDFISMEGFQTTSGNNSNAYAFISGADIVPIIPGVPARTWELTSNVTSRKSFRILFANVGPGGAQQGNRIATEIEGAKNNWGIWIGMSMVYLDQTSSGIVKLGDFILGTRFRE